MHLIPYEKFEIRTVLERRQIFLVLDGLTEKRKWALHPPRDSKPFAGVVREDGFRIFRVIRYRNSFLPVIRGQIDGSVIRMTMRLHRFAAAFLVFWCGSVLSFFLISLAAHPQEAQDARQALLFRAMTLGMILFIYLLSTISFHFEAEKAKKILTEAFKGLAIQPSKAL